MPPRTYNGIPLAGEEDPFDIALPLYYVMPRQPVRYRALVELGAQAGDPLAQYAMATWFLFGNAELGILRDTSRAVSLLVPSAATLNRAMYDLAICKLRGQGTRQDDRGAYRLLVRAAELGCIPAMKAQAYCLREGVGVKRNRPAAARIAKLVERFVRKKRRVLL